MTRARRRVGFVLIALLFSMPAAASAADLTPPYVTAPKPAIPSGATVQATSLPVRWSWAASDKGSGLCSTAAAQSLDGSSFSTVSLGSATAKSLTGTLTPAGATYQLETRATDCTGNVSSWMVGPLVSAQILSESDPSITYTGTWSTVADSNALGGQLMDSIQPGATATVQFMGRNIAWIAPRGPDAGAANVSVDGGSPVSVNLNKSGKQSRRVVFTRAWSTAGQHTLTITVVGTSGHPHVRLDGFAVIQPGPLRGAAMSWHSLASTGFARQEVAFTYLDGLFYLAGGESTRQQVYDPATDSWSDVAPLPNSLDHFYGVPLNHKIYYIGGLIHWPSPEVGTVTIYDPATDSFSSGATMPRTRGAGGVAAYQGKIYYVGGLHGGLAVPWFDVYDPATDSWATLPDMPRPRDHLQAVVVGHMLYAIGGRNEDINATTPAVDAYDFDTGQWTTGYAPLPTQRGGYAAAAFGNTIIVVGGEGGGQAWSTVEAYDTVNDSWSTLPSMPTGRHGIQAAVCDGGMYIPAGSTKQGRAPTSVFEVFFPGTPQSCTDP
jgi:N-acetylneuraminic acid mutarotase